MLNRAPRHWARWLALGLTLAYIPWGFHRFSFHPGAVRPANPVSRFPLRTRWVALGFADTVSMPLILNDLAAENDHATFFVTGMNAARQKQWLAMAKRLGDDVESHTQGHINLAVHPYRQDVVDLRKANRAIAHAVGRRPRWLYPPYGAVGSKVLKAALRVKLRVVLPSVGEWVNADDRTPADMIHQVLSHVRGGAIIIFDNPPPAALSWALPEVLALLSIKGYHVGSVAQLWRISSLR